MFRSKIVTAWFILFCFLAPMTAFAGTFHYTVRIPASSQSCQQEADSLKNRFATEAGVTVIDATCRGTVSLDADSTTYKLYSLLLTYQAVHEITPYEAVFGTSDVSSTPGSLDGIYDTYATCIGDLPSQTKSFESATGLITTAGFCTPVDDIDHAEYKLHIQGVGGQKASLFVFNPNFTGTEDAQTQGGVEILINRLGGTIVKEYGSQVFYYAPYPLSLSLKPAPRLVSHKS